MRASQNSLGDRMKAYESVFDASFPARMPLIVRVDGKAFHSYTRGFRRPVDERLVSVMDDTAKALCREIQGARLAYVQSDEISVLCVDYAELNTQAWMAGRVQKVVSVAAGVASSTFTELSRVWVGESPKTAVFDARAFVIPKEDVCNYFLWRQQDATRNSVQGLARSLYSHKECVDKSGPELQEMCHVKGANWNDVPTSQKRGRCVVKMLAGERSWWTVDEQIPIFSQDRAYIERLVMT